MEELLRQMLGGKVVLEYGHGSHFVGRVTEVSRVHVALVNEDTSSGVSCRLISLASVHAFETLDA